MEDDLTQDNRSVKIQPKGLTPSASKGLASKASKGVTPKGVQPSKGVASKTSKGVTPKGVQPSKVGKKGPAKKAPARKSDISEKRRMAQMKGVEKRRKKKAISGIREDLLSYIDTAFGDLPSNKIDLFRRKMIDQIQILQSADLLESEEYKRPLEFANNEPRVPDSDPLPSETNFFQSTDVSQALHTESSGKYEVHQGHVDSIGGQVPHKQLLQSTIRDKARMGMQLMGNKQLLFAEPGARILRRNRLKNYGVQEVNEPLGKNYYAGKLYHHTGNIIEKGDE